MLSNFFLLKFAGIIILRKNERENIAISLIKSAKYLLLLVFLCSQANMAQYYFFGRNKVQYQKFDWKVIHTDHFDIYYYGQMGEIAEIGADYAENIYNELKTKFNSVVTNRIPLIFYNTSLHFQQTNTTPGFIPDAVGGFFEFIKGRVVIPYTGALKDFRHVIRHEIVHVFMTIKVIRVLADHRLPTDVFPPLWFVEGLAEYLSTTVDAQAEMVMRDAVINGYFVNLENIGKIYGSFQMYKEGQNFLHFIDKKYGEDKVMLMLDNIWMYNDFDEVMEYTLGKTIKEIDNEWEYSLKKKYYPLLEKSTPTFIEAKQLTDFGFNFSPVHFKIEGKDYLYFVANRDGYSSLYRLEIGDGKEKERDPELILRGEKQAEFEAFHLFQSSIDISKDGLLAFVTKAGATDAVHFYSVTEKKVIKNFQMENLISITSPKFSRDGKKIVFHAIDQKGFSDLYILDVGTFKITRITNDYYDERDPVFGPDGEQIIFSSDRTAGKFTKKYNLFSYNLTSHKITYITYLNANCSSPVFSPDNKNILFTSDYDGVYNIWSIQIRDSNYTHTVHKVTHFITSAFYPAFINSSDITFSGFEKFGVNLYTMKFDSSAVDTSKKLVMYLDSTAGKWNAQKLFVPAGKQELKYKKEYTLDYAQSQVTTDPVFGTRGGAVLSLSDLMGDDNYYFLIYNTADVQSEILKSFNVEIQRINLGSRSNYGYGVFNFSGRRYDIRESNEYFYERSFGGFFVLHFPLSKFQRIEANVTIASSDKQVIEGVIERKALLLSNSLSYVFDNSLWGPTGPLDGIRARFLLGYTGDVKYSNVNYFTVIADYRQYLRLGYMSALAFRGALFYNEGKEARRYFMGGSWDLRGWPRWSIRGEKMWLSSLELRFPLIDQLRLKFPFMDLGFFGIRGALYFDAGSAWDTKYKSTLGSLGGGVRFNLFGAIVLRYDVGKKIEDDFTRFQPGLFYQFFFGWDF